MGEVTREARRATAKAVVARGRTVRIGGVDMTDAKVVLRVWSKDFGPGAEVELPAEDVDRLRASGVLLAEGAKFDGAVPRVGLDDDTIRPR